jgi:hypothetical protein
MPHPENKMAKRRLSKDRLNEMRKLSKEKKKSSNSKKKNLQNYSVIIDQIDKNYDSRNKINLSEYYQESDQSFQKYRPSNIKEKILPPSINRRQSDLASYRDARKQHKLRNKYSKEQLMPKTHYSMMEPETGGATQGRDLINMSYQMPGRILEEEEVYGGGVNNIHANVNANANANLRRDFIGGAGDNMSRNVGDSKAYDILNTNTNVNTNMDRDRDIRNSGNNGDRDDNKMLTGKSNKDKKVLKSGKKKKKKKLNKTGNLSGTKNSYTSFMKSGNFEKEFMEEIHDKKNKKKIKKKKDTSTDKKISKPEDSNFLKKYESQISNLNKDSIMHYQSNLSGAKGDYQSFKIDSQMNPNNNSVSNKESAKDIINIYNDNTKHMTNNRERNSQKELPSNSHIRRLSNFEKDSNFYEYSEKNSIAQDFSKHSNTIKPKIFKKKTYLYYTH